MSEMTYNRLGRAGIRLSEISLGSWITFARNLDSRAVKECMRFAYDRGVNFFDNAEAYADGEAEVLMGHALQEYRREDLVISTKLFWGGDGPNDEGLSWKHIVEGTKNSLKRLRTDYVDLIYCHRADPDTPLEETIRAMDHVVRSGYAFYWGTSEWTAEEIREAHEIAAENNCIPPAMEQPEYHMFKRERVEKEYQELYDDFGMGATIWSPLNSGILTGKYNDGLPKGSRLEMHEWLRHELTEDKAKKVRALTKLSTKIGCSMAQLAIAWCLKNPNVSTVITGSSSMEQLTENLGALDVKAKLDEDVIGNIESILDNRPL